MATADLSPEGIASLREISELNLLGWAAGEWFCDRKQLVDAIAEAEVVIAGYECFDEALLAAAPRLRAILVIELEFNLAVLHWRWKPPQSHSLNGGGRPRDGAGRPVATGRFVAQPASWLRRNAARITRGDSADFSLRGHGEGPATAPKPLVRDDHQRRKGLEIAMAAISACDY
ncbi:hypothetical protein [Mesorhizobium sp. M0139]|uniref:hypothetical protein n=1 Tax=Mesorhizobium sp. M0139 TaxID=2956892 RepID=UPI003336FF77